MELEAYKDFSLTDRDGEIWRDIPNFEGLYQVSNHGRVKSLCRLSKQNHLLKESIRRCGIKEHELNITLRDHDSHRHCLCVNRLVAFVFLPTPENEKKYVVFYKDGNYYNCHVDNLFYGTTDALSNKLTDRNDRRSYFIGVYRQQKHIKAYYIAQSHLNGKQIYIGLFHTEIEAAKAYDDFIVKHNLKRKGNFIDNR